MKIEQYLKNEVIKFMDSQDTNDGKFYFKVGEGRLDEDEEYTNKNSYIFVIRVRRSYDDTPCTSELVHAVKRKNGYLLILASCINWYPSKKNCQDWKLINLDFDKKMEMSA